MAAIIPTVAALLTACWAGAAAAQAASPPVPPAAPVPAVAPPALDVGRHGFVFAGWDGPPIKVWTYVPASADRRRAPIAIIMHGVGRDADRYREQWVAHADAGGFVVVAPEFDAGQFPGANGYNLGHLTERDSGAPREENLWSFSAIEPLFDEVRRRLGSEQSGYTLYGHSAGSQFVHRLLWMKPGARATRFIPANAGWYSFPDLTRPYPYGLGGAPVDAPALRAALARDVVILLGARDHDARHPSLNRSAGAMAQGRHRLARGKAFFAAARDVAQANGWTFGWRLELVPGADHDNAKMAPAAARLVQ